MSGDKGIAGRGVWRVEAGTSLPADDVLAEEVPVAIHYDGVPFAVMMASPGDLEDFAVGFSLTERRALPADIMAIEVREQLEGIVLDIRRRERARTTADARAIPGRSGCGICGSRLLEEVLRRPAAVEEGAMYDSRAIESALDALQSSQPMNAATGALHAAAWCRADGTLGLVREDVGRHNALDKLIGAMHRQRIDTRRGFALVTSRASSEMAMKAAEAGITMLAAMSAPTALAVDLARDSNLTLVGFTRPGRHVVYSHPRRLRDADGSLAAGDPRPPGRLPPAG